MTVLIAAKLTDWMTNAELKETLAPMMPDARIVCPGDAYDADDIDMLIVDRLDPGEAGALPNLKLIQKLGAGVETILRQSDLPQGVRITRLKPQQAAKEMTDFALAHVMGEQMHLAHYRTEQAAGRWTPIAPRQSSETVVGVLGLGNVGGRVARTFAALDFQVLGYSRSPKSLDGVTCLSGETGLAQVLAEADHVISVLPATPETVGLMNADRFRTMKPGALFMNIGRGDLVVDTDLVAALDAGRPGRAVLDVFHREPLPSDHPFWTHEKVTIAPHVSGWHVDDGLKDVADNWRRLASDATLINEVDRGAGY